MDAANHIPFVDLDNPFDPVPCVRRRLVDGNGSVDNASFTLDLNGTLRSTEIFDFETKIENALDQTCND